MTLLAVTTLAMLLAGCGGGGTTSSASSGVAGSVSVNVAFGGNDTPVTVSSSSSDSTGTLAPATSTVKVTRDSFDNVIVYMTGVAFMPVEDGADIRPPDMVNGEPLADGPGDSSNGAIRYTFPKPVVFDLLNPPTSRQIAKFLNKIEVPAGVYHKIRVYYEKVVVDGQIAHRTANGHLDIHFKANDAWDSDDVHVDNRGYLVIPVAPNPSDGVRLYCVAIRITGLMVKENPVKIQIRPQVFAELARPVKYSITGQAENVVHPSRSFDIRSYSSPPPLPTANVFPTVYHPDTKWAFSDNVFDPNAWKVTINHPAITSAALDNLAFVEAIGVFNATSTPMTFRADRIFITFPYVREGYVDNGWRSDDTFVLRLAQDNVVYPMPGRGTAYYDNLADPAQHLDNTFIDNNVFVKARGYNVVDGIRAFWISIGETLVGP